jgi:hypothetical protein
MAFDQYHEPPDELPQETRTFARMILSLIEEAQAIDWYEQRMALEKDRDAKAIMKNAQKEEFKHFAMDLEWLFRHKTEWRETAKCILFTKGDIVKAGEKAKKRLMTDQPMPACFPAERCSYLRGTQAVSLPVSAALPKRTSKTLPASCRQQQASSLCSPG